MSAGDLRYFDPGEQVPVILLANSSGAVAARGDPVEIVDQKNGFTRVQLAEHDGTAIGGLVRRPVEYDPTANYTAGDMVGESATTILTLGPVDWCKPSGGFTPTVDDLVVSDVGGTVRAYDSATDTTNMIYGRVFATGARETQQTAGEAAILRGEV